MKLSLSKALLYHHLSPSLRLFLISSNSSLHPCPSRVYSEQSDSVKHKSNHITPLVQSPRWLPSHSMKPRSSYGPRGPPSLTSPAASSLLRLSPPQMLWSFCSPDAPAACTSAQLTVTRGLSSTIQVSASVIQPEMRSLLQIRLLPPQLPSLTTPFSCPISLKALSTAIYVVCL